MFLLINQFRELLKGIHEILKLLIELWQIAKRYPLLFILVLGGFGTYYALRWYAFDYPQRCIYTFYKSLGAHEFDKAWNCLAEDYRNSRWSSQAQFESAYQTMASPSGLTVDFTESKLNPFRILVKPANTYVVQYDEEERFTRALLDHQQQKENRLWLQIAHPDSFQHLLDGTLGNDNPSLKLNRFFKESVIVKHTHSGWVIASIHRTSRGLK